VHISKESLESFREAEAFFSGEKDLGSANKKNYGGPIFRKSGGAGSEMAQEFPGREFV